VVTRKRALTLSQRREELPELWFWGSAGFAIVALQWQSGSRPEPLQTHSKVRSRAPKSDICWSVAGCGGATCGQRWGSVQAARAWLATGRARPMVGWSSRGGPGLARWWRQYCWFYGRWCFFFILVMWKWQHCWVLMDLWRDKILEPLPCDHYKRSLFLVCH
jgi:hypothetical protein